jgi:tetratricopeptide (TPR) repeat protein
MRRVYALILVLSMVVAGCVQAPSGEDPAALLAQADALLDEERPADAIPLIEEALAREDSAEGHFLLGNAYSHSDRLTEAEDEYLQALALDPDHVDARANLAVVYYSSGRLEEAEEAIRLALEGHEGDADLHYNLGGILAAQGRTVDAEVEFLTALDLDPDLPEVHLGLGLLYRDLGRTDEAIPALERYLELSDDPEWRAEAEAALAALEAE